MGGTRFMITSLTVCADMRGCPNRCRHCWMGHAPNPRLTEDDLRFIHDAFRPWVQKMELDTWTREPDFPDHYREMWALREALSDEVTPHFELMSVWRAARDQSYIPWLRDMGVRRMQLTLFGGEALTDRYAGRRGVYQEILTSIHRLIEHGVAPRIQVFLNRETAGELHLVEELILKERLVERCQSIGQDFSAFVHAGSCDGENEKNYPIWPTWREVEKIPPLLAELTLGHFGAKSLEEVFGSREAEWFELLKNSNETSDIAAEKLADRPVIFLDGDLNAYPNLSAPAPHWRLGNLRLDGARAILTAFLENASPAQRARLTTPLGEMVRACGNPAGEGLFDRDDYIGLTLNRYCREHGR